MRGGQVAQVLVGVSWCCDVLFTAHNTNALSFWWFCLDPYLSHTFSLLVVLLLTGGAIFPSVGRHRLELMLALIFMFFVYFFFLFSFSCSKLFPVSLHDDVSPWPVTTVTTDFSKKF